MSFFHTFNQFIGNLDVFRAKFWNIHMIFNSSKRNQRFCFEVFNKKLLNRCWTFFQILIDHETKSETFWWIFKDLHIYLTILSFLKKVCQLEYVELKLENNCWFWSITIKNFWYWFFTNSADPAEILPSDTNFWDVCPFEIHKSSP